MTRHEHVGAAVPTTITASINASDLSISLASNTGWPTGAVGSFFCAIDPGTASEEKILCASQSGSVLTVTTRGADNTTGKIHPAGAVIYPVWTATEADEVNAHANAVADIHGVTGNLANAVLTASEGQIIVAASATSGTAINAAIAALPGGSAGGGKIILAAGTHTLDVAISVNKGDLIIEGMGTGVAPTIVEWNPAAFATAFAMADTTRRRIVLRNFDIRPAGVAAAGTAIDFGYFTNSVIEQLRIGSVTGGAPNIAIDLNQVGGYYNVIRDNIIIVGGASPIGIRNGSDCNSNTFHNNLITGQAGVTGTPIGMQLTGTAHSTTIQHLDVEGATAFIGLDVGATNNLVNAIGCYFEAVSIGIRLGNGCKAVNIIGCNNHLNTTANIQDNGCNGLVKIGNYFDSFQDVVSVNGIQLPDNTMRVDDRGIIAENYDIVAAQNNTVTTSGTLYLMRVPIRWPRVISNVTFSVQTAGVTPVANQSWVGLYNTAGTRVAVSTAGALDVPIVSTGVKTIPLAASYTSTNTDRYVWVAILINAATNPAIARGNGNLGNPYNFGLTATNLRFATNGTGLTALPNPITPASNTSTSSLSYWVALT